MKLWKSQIKVIIMYQILNFKKRLKLVQLQAFEICVVVNTAHIRFPSILTLKNVLDLEESLKDIGNDTIWKLGYGFLFAFHSNYGLVLYHFRDKARHCWKSRFLQRDAASVRMPVRLFVTRRYSIEMVEYTIKQQQYLFAIGGWKPEGHKPIRAGSKKK